jgi:uncharacterized lipoprotein YbaY
MVTGGCYHRSPRASLWPKLLFSLCFLSVIPPSRLEPPRFQPANSSQQSPNSAQAANPQQAPAQPPISPPDPKRSSIRFVLTRHTYQCAGGVQLVAIVETDALRLTLNGNGQVYELKKTESAGPNMKYSSGPIVWSSDVQTGRLEDDSDAANPKILAKDCRLQSAFPAHSPANSISGMLNFSPTKGLPPEAEIRIELLDRTPSDDHHRYLAVKLFNWFSQKPPIPFELKFNPQEIRSKDCCALFAEIRGNNGTLYATSGPQPIDDIFQPGTVKLELVPAPKTAAQP